MPNARAAETHRTPASTLVRLQGGLEAEGGEERERGLSLGRVEGLEGKGDILRTDLVWLCANCGAGGLSVRAAGGFLSIPPEHPALSMLRLGQMCR